MEIYIVGGYTTIKLDIGGYKGSKVDMWSDLVMGRCRRT